MLLAGDLGGTKTHLAIFASAEALQNGEMLVETTLPSKDFPSLEALVNKFLATVDQREQISHASFGVAGPVSKGEAAITNLPWTMNEKQLAEAINVSSVELLNDLVAVASAVPFLGASDLYTLNVGKAVEEGTMAVVAPGTGLGEAYLTWDGRHYRARASEGGHVDFGPTNALELEMLDYLLRRYDHVSYERVCSGMGLPNIYDFLKDSGHAEEPAWLTKELAMATDRTPIIVNNAQDAENAAEICVKTLDMFISILATEAGNMALKVFASGGVYLGGGMPPRILPLLGDGRFMEIFAHKGRFSNFLKNAPVHVILNRDAALLGAAYHGYDL